MKCKNCGHKLIKDNFGEWKHIYERIYRKKLIIPIIVCYCGCSKPEPTQTPHTSTIPGAI